MYKWSVLWIGIFFESMAGFSQPDRSPAPAQESSGYYKKAVALSNSNLDSEVYYFERYRKTTVKPDSVVKQRSIDFYNYVGSRYLSEGMSDSINHPQSPRKALGYLGKVLEYDSLNLPANMNTMIAYLNNGIATLLHADYCKQRQLKEKADWRGEIPSLDKLLECVKPEEYETFHITPLFKAALPYAARVHRLDPENISALEALRGVYTLLLDKKQAKHFAGEKAKIENKQKSINNSTTWF